MLQSYLRTAIGVEISLKGQQIKSDIKYEIDYNGQSKNCTIHDKLDLAKLYFGAFRQPSFRSTKPFIWICSSDLKVKEFIMRVMITNSFNAFLKMPIFPAAMKDTNFGKLAKIIIDNFLKIDLQN